MFCTHYLKFIEPWFEMNVSPTVEAKISAMSQFKTCSLYFLKFSWIFTNKCF